MTEEELIRHYEALRYAQGIIYNVYFPDTIQRRAKRLYKHIKSIVDNSNREELTEENNRQIEKLAAFEKEFGL